MCYPSMVPVLLSLFMISVKMQFLLLPGSLFLTEVHLRYTQYMTVFIKMPRLALAHTRSEKC